MGGPSGGNMKGSSTQTKPASPLSLKVVGNRVPRLKTPPPGAGSPAWAGICDSSPRFTKKRPPSSSTVTLAPNNTLPRLLMRLESNTSRKVLPPGVGSPRNTRGVNTNPVGSAKTACDPVPTTATSSATPTTATRRCQNVCLLIIVSSSSSVCVRHPQPPVHASPPSPGQHPLSDHDSGRLSRGNPRPRQMLYMTSS